MSNQTAQGLAADLAALTSGAGVTFTWIAQVNDVLQLMATGVAIVAGIYAIKWHKVRITKLKETSDEQSKRDGS